MAKLFTDIVLEVGRMCNLQCDHCLRGECENLTMPFEIAKKAIDLVTDIKTITFSNFPIIINCINSIKKIKTVIITIIIIIY